MADPAPAAPADPVAHGVSLRAYARVIAALAEDPGVGLEAALEHGGVDPQAWSEVERAFADLLGRAPRDDPALLLAFDAQLAEAREELTRPTPPLDEDLGAWLDFLRTWAAQEDPLRRLGELGLRDADILRLSRRWARRMEGDEALRAAAASVLGRAPREVEIPRPPRSALARGERSARAVARASALMVNIPRLSVPLPVEEEKASEASAAPRLDLAGLVGTALALDVPRGPALPFVPAEKNREK